MVHGADKKASFWKRVEIPFRLQLMVGSLYGHNGDLKMLGQGPLGREPFPGRQGAAENVLPDMAVQGFIERQAVLSLQAICKHKDLRSGLVKKLEIGYFHHITCAL